MPLLRLLHQISNMYQNVKETQSELREQQPDNKVVAKTPPALVTSKWTQTNTMLHQKCNNKFFYTKLISTDTMSLSFKIETPFLLFLPKLFISELTNVPYAI